MSTNPIYPIVVVSETSSVSDFEYYNSHVFSEDMKETVMGTSFPITVKYYDTYNTTGLDIITPSGVTNGVSIALEGTSSLTYMSKGYELYMGDVDSTGKKMLF
jgi:hypothetical protein